MSSLFTKLPGIVVSLLLLLAPAQAGEHAVAHVLDDFHEAASKADAARYFGHFAPEGVFLGTDASERWTVEQFKAYAMPYFEQGKGWTYRPGVRHITLSPDGNTAWFDESLENDSYGQTRGSGVLSVPIPNDLLPEIVRQIKK